MNYLVPAVLLSTALACSPKPDQTKESIKQPSIPEHSLELVWETDSILTTAECVLYDKARDVIYVANINEGPWEKDGSGFISQLSTSGEIIENKWIEGLDAPKGMVVKGASLFTNDIDQLVEIDIEAGEIKNKIKFDDDPNLNGLTVDQDGVLFAAGSKSFKIYRIANDTVSILIDGDLGRPNGVLAENDRLLMLTNHTHKLMAIDYQTKEMITLADSLGHADGIVPVGDGAYIVSNWKGQVYFLSRDMKRTLLLDTTEEEINAADIEFIPEKNLLLVPTFFDNRVRAYRLVK